MTRLQKDPHSITNHLDAIIPRGKRGSSFIDIDAFGDTVGGPTIVLSHDWDSGNRFLFMELKWVGEEGHPAQRKALEALAREKAITVWLVILDLESGTVEWADLQRHPDLRTLTHDEFVALYRAWWDQPDRYACCAVTRCVVPGCQVCTTHECGFPPAQFAGA